MWFLSQRTREQHIIATILSVPYQSVVVFEAENMDREVEGKVVAVTGAANGLGLAIVTSFLEQGVGLAILLDLDKKKGKEVVADLQQRYGDDRAVFYKCDVTDDLEKVFGKIYDNHENIDILVNNAGVLDEGNIKKTMDINATAVMEWTVKFYKKMSVVNGGRGGTIINVSSIYGYRITPFIPYYHASKYAVIGFSKSIGHELNFQKSGVRVVTLCPGLTHTNLAANPNAWDDSLDEFLEHLTTYEWQDPSSIGDGTVDVFRYGNSGSVWLVEGSRPAVEIGV